MRTALSVVFFLSGVSALIYETLWFRLAGLALGNSVWSVSLVLAAFMGGIALGNALIARHGHRIARPLALYAALEVAIGIAGTVVVVVLPRSSELLGPPLGALIDTPWMLNGVRLAIGFLVLAVPATAMGATLPALAQALSRSEPNFGSALGQLYGWNTLGAMLGAIVCEAVLIGSLGLQGSGLSAMALNFTVALLALRIARSEEPRGTAAPAQAVPALARPERRLLAAAFLFGAILLALEVVWFRFLLLTYHGTSLIFAVMLAVVLGGIACGGLLASRLYRINERCHVWLRHTAALNATLVVLTYYGFDWFTEHQTRIIASAWEFVPFAVFLMLPVSMLSGLCFTMVGRALKDRLATPVRTAGIATFWNTLGAMSGSILGGFVLLPYAGMERSFFILATAYGITALVVPRVEGAETRLTTRFALASAAAVAVSLVVFPFGLMQRVFYHSFMVRIPGYELVASREGLTETILYYSRRVHGAHLYHRLITNRFSMSGTSPHAKRYMKLFVYLPVALMREPRSALLISYGVGSTAKALADTASLEAIDVVDISRDILEMSSVVYDDDVNPLRDRRVRAFVEDGRFFLSSTDKRYDLITSEPPPPKLAGVVNLYSREYFELIRERLNRGGYASYWLPVHQLEPLDSLAIINAFCAAFEDCSLWVGAGLDWVLLGSNGATNRPSAAQFGAQWRDPVVGPELRALGFESAEQLGSLFLADAAQLGKLAEGIPPVIDDRPHRLSPYPLTSVVKYELYQEILDGAERLERFKGSGYIAQRWPAALGARAEPYFRYERMINNHDTTSRHYRGPADPNLWESVDDVLDNTSLRTLPLWLLGSDPMRQDLAEELAQAGRAVAALEVEKAIRRTVERDYSTALAHMRNYMRRATKPGRRAHGLFLYLLSKNGLLAEARSVLEAMPEEVLRISQIEEFVAWFATRIDASSDSARASSGPSAEPARARPDP
jgi:predicted membrane-bound spermidine synthase